MQTLFCLSGEVALGGHTKTYHILMAWIYHFLAVKDTGRKHMDKNTCHVRNHERIGPQQTSVFSC